MSTASYQNQIEVIKMYLEGESKNAISKKFNISPKVVTDIIEQPEMRLEVEKKFFALDKAKENRKISEVKDDIINYIQKAVQEQSKEPGKLAYMKEITAAISELDRISRLNSGEVTERTESTTKNINYDIGKLMENLKTPEEKKRWLQGQINNS